MKKLLIPISLLILSCNQAPPQQEENTLETAVFTDITTYIERIPDLHLDTIYTSNNTLNITVSDSFEMTPNGFISIVEYDILQRAGIFSLPFDTLNFTFKSQIQPVEKTTNTRKEFEQWAYYRSYDANPECYMAMDSFFKLEHMRSIQIILNLNLSDIVFKNKFEDPNALGLFNQCLIECRGYNQPIGIGHLIAKRSNRKLFRELKDKLDSTGGNHPIVNQIRGLMNYVDQLCNEGYHPLTD